MKTTWYLRVVAALLGLTFGLASVAAAAPPKIRNFVTKPGSASGYTTGGDFGTIIGPKVNVKVPRTQPKWQGWSPKPGPCPLDQSCAR
jgi:hypothetical protein